MTPEQKKFDDIKNYKDYNVIGYDVNYKVIINDEAEEVVLQFQETNSDEDWTNNLLAFPWPLKLETGYKRGKTIWTTYGYARAYRSTSSEPVMELLHEAAHLPTYKICVRGWSLGSAMAKIATRHLEALGCEVDELTTYGDVKCWVNPFYKAKATIAREYTTPNDFVTWLVPFYWRDHKCSVGPRFRLREIFKTQHYHSHYEEYDYSKYEEEDYT